MQATEIDGELVVHEDPQIVVTFEGERFPSVVDELRVDLGREGEVVELVVVPLARHVAAGDAGTLPARAVEREEELAVERDDALAGECLEMEIEEVGLVDAV